ncbi:MAG: hypothetical protein ACREBU_06560 [Nitrososphaera sp.]
MEFMESVAWIALGFIPTYVALEAGWRISRRRLAPAEVKLGR